MHRLHHPQHHGHWSYMLTLLAVLAALACARPAHAVVSIRLVKDINTTGSSEPSLGAIIGNTLFFSADDGVHGIELWKSDGTSAGTTLVKDINLAGASLPGYLPAIGTTLFFTADDGVHGIELWRSDGTEAGTTLIQDITPSSGGLGPVNLAALGSTLFFLADDGLHGYELWKSDGTSAGTTLVKDINPTGEGTWLGGLVPIGSTLFFTADDGVHGRELWTSDGTESGTKMVKDIISGGGPYDPFGIDQLTAVGSTLFFSAAGGLWKSDGTANGTLLVRSINPVPLLAVGNTLFFGADDGVHGRELWMSDGTTAGTVLIKDINPTGGSLSPSDWCEFTAVGSRLFFNANDGVHGFEPWTSDGTSAGTILVKDINPGGGSSLDLDNRAHFRAVGNTLFFSADDGVHGFEPFASDGTPDGTTLIEDLNPGAASADPSDFVGLGTSVFFGAQTAATGDELWATIMDPSYSVYLPLTRR